MNLTTESSESGVGARTGGYYYAHGTVATDTNYAKPKQISAEEAKKIEQVFRVKKILGARYGGGRKIVIWLDEEGKAEGMDKPPEKSYELRTFNKEWYQKSNGKFEGT